MEPTMYLDLELMLLYQVLIIFEINSQHAKLLN